MLEKLLITGASGGLGRICRESLKPLAKTIRLTARSGLGDAGENEEIVYGSLDDPEALAEIVEGCDGLVHLGGQATEAKWETIRSANIDGMVNLYEAVRLSTTKPRIVFASSNHTIGFYPQSQRLDTRSPVRPDGYYGVSKVFGEALASMYYDKFGIETAAVRIGSFAAAPENYRMLSTWLSHRDFVQLVARIFAVPVLGYQVIYGASANSAGWWDNSAVSFLGWQPQDNAETYRAKVEQLVPRPSAEEPIAKYQGGIFCADPILKD